MSLTTSQSLAVRANDKREQERNLEIGTKKPNLTLMLREIERARPKMDHYLSRNALALQYWNSQWDGQTSDGRRRCRDGESPADVFPWDGASDARLRTVKEHVRDHITILKAAFEGAQVQAWTASPFAEGTAKRASTVTRTLRHQLFTEMRAELQREIPLAWAWRFGYGASVLRVDWEQARRLEYHELTVPLLADIIAQRDMLDEEMMRRFMFQVQAALFDPTQHERLADLLRSIPVDKRGEPILTKAQAMKAVRELASMGTTEIALPAVYKSKPRWTARRIGVDFIFRDLTGDIQQEPWTLDIERVSETDLIDRIELEDYSAQFVEEILRHKGKRDGYQSDWLSQTNRERSEAYGGAYYDVDEDDGGLTLYHFRYKAITHGAPCMYRTIFSPHQLSERHRSDNPLYAKHGHDPFEHKQYPFVPMRYEKEHREITSSQGIPELTYTFENEMKVQADGLADRTQLVNSPPITVSYSKAQAIRGTRMPGAVLPVNRANDVQWMPLPPSDGTPVQVMRQVGERLREFLGIFGADIDPEKKLLRRQELANDALGELALAIMMTKELDGQYLPEAAEFTAAKDVTATFNARMLNEDYASSMMDLYQKAMAFNQNGNANTSGIFRRAIELFDPDAADEVVENDQTATERERREEKAAALELLNGMEADKPQFANHQLRLQVLQEVMQQPKTQQKLMGDPDLLALFENRMEFHQNQLQQYGENPQIGRAVSTQTFDKTKAPRMSLAGAS